MLRMLKRFGLNKDELITVYKGYIRPLLEYADVIWNSSLTLKQTKTIEQVQRRACRIVLGHNFLSYNKALSDCEIESLATGGKTIALSLPKGLLILKGQRIFLHLLRWRVIPAIFAMLTRFPNCVLGLRVLKIALSLTSLICWMNNFGSLTLTSLHAYLSIYFFCVCGGRGFGTWMECKGLCVWMWMISVDGYLQVNACVWVCSNLHIWDLKRNGIIFLFCGDFFSQCLGYFY